MLALSGVLAYYIFDYLKYKKDTDNQLNMYGSNVTVETSNRQSNVKSIVDQVNAVNSSMYNQELANAAFTSNVSAAQSSFQSGLLNSFGNLLSFTSNSPLGGRPSSVSLMNLPGTGNVDMNLLHRVNAMMGLTVPNLSGTNQVKLCSSADPSRCTQFPNSNGDVYLASMRSNSAVIIDANTTRVTGAITSPNYTLSGGSGSLEANGTGVLLAANSNITITAASNTSVNVTPDGHVDVYGNLNLVNAQNVRVAKIYKSTDGVVIESPKVTIKGNVEVQGTLAKSDPNGANLKQVALQP
jgi:hypothetical protein